MRVGDHESLSTATPDKTIVTLRVGLAKPGYKVIVAAATLREKSEYFARLLTSNWDQSAEIPIAAPIELHDFQIFIDWLDGRQVRCFTHYMHGAREGPLTEVVFDAEDQWPLALDIKVDSRKSRYCHHLCQLWIRGVYFGEEFQEVVMERLRKITMSYPWVDERVISANEPDWTTAFVISPSTVRYIFGRESVTPLHEWAIQVTASSLDRDQLREFASHELPDRFMTNVYQTKLWLTDLAHKEELENLRRELGASCSPTTTDSE